jgi:hypothetical protein
MGIFNTSSATYRIRSNGSGIGINPDATNAELSNDLIVTAVELKETEFPSIALALREIKAAGSEIGVSADDTSSSDPVLTFGQVFGTDKRPAIYRGK